MAYESSEEGQLATARPHARVVGHGHAPAEATTHGQAPKGVVGYDQGHLQGRPLEGAVARDQGYCQQARSPAGMVGACGHRQHPQGRRSQSCPLRE
ncbi:hypothetical protein B296_00055043 [Ensete ventricosum]|uniref:Uncharacterized protein n=1 Tax=Ensete ventricosum TaxID=4639 RepID=A0A426XEE6_ENSVE|nr:hypothetical protein B296_00055043 [Ensete ventricosum]